MPRNSYILVIIEFVRLNNKHRAYFPFYPSLLFQTFLHYCRSCECQCEEAVFGSQKAMCETRSTTYWDSKSCQCRSKSVAPRETDAMIANCLEDFPMMAYTRNASILDNSQPQLLYIWP